MPIDTNHPLIAASRYADAQSEEFGLAGAIAQNNIDMGTLVYAAQQRALRMTMLAARGPESLMSMSKTRKGEVYLSETEQEMFDQFVISYLDGMFIGWKAANINNEER